MYYVSKYWNNASLLDNGFTNYHKPTIYLVKSVANDVTINISLGSKETSKDRKAKIQYLDEGFLQGIDMSNPSTDYLKNAKKLGEEVVQGLLNKGILIEGGE